MGYQPRLGQALPLQRELYPKTQAGQSARPAFIYGVVSSPAYGSSGGLDQDLGLHHEVLALAINQDCFARLESAVEDAFR
jgi:hypothetical protein